MLPKAWPAHGSAAPLSLLMYPKPTHGHTHVGALQVPCMLFHVHIQLPNECTHGACAHTLTCVHM